MVPGEGDVGGRRQGGRWCWQEGEVAGARCDAFKMEMCYCQAVCHGLRKLVQSGQEYTAGLGQNSLWFSVLVSAARLGFAY